jgi:hypothetical protein
MVEAISLGKVYNGFSMWAWTTQEKAANHGFEPKQQAVPIVQWFRTGPKVNRLVFKIGCLNYIWTQGTWCCFLLGLIVLGQFRPVKQNQYIEVLKQSS